MSKERSETAAPSEHSRWPYISLIPIGLGAWAPIYAGVKVRSRSWITLGVLWSAIVVAGFVKNSLSHSGHSGTDDLAGFLIILGWVGAIATSFSIRSTYERRAQSALDSAAATGEERLRDRQRALQIVARDPALAREIGIGRPDRPGAMDAGLIDINNAPQTVLRQLPGVTAPIAEEIIRAREQVHGFSSLEDLGTVADLDGALVERLRGTAVFLPR